MARLLLLHQMHPPLTIQHLPHAAIAPTPARLRVCLSCVPAHHRGGGSGFDPTPTVFATRTPHISCTAAAAAAAAADVSSCLPRRRRRRRETRRYPPPLFLLSCVRVNTFPFSAPPCCIRVANPPLKPPAVTVARPTLPEFRAFHQVDVGWKSTAHHSDGWVEVHASGTLSAARTPAAPQSLPARTSRPPQAPRTAATESLGLASGYARARPSARPHGGQRQ